MASRDMRFSKVAGGSVVWRNVSGSSVPMVKKREIYAHTSLLFGTKVAVSDIMLQNMI
jgi:uncharacterized membrane protein YeiH